MVILAISSSLFQSQTADLLPCNKVAKSQLIWGLLNAYNLLEQFDHVITDPYCSPEELLQFHDAEYVATLLNESLALDVVDTESMEQWQHMAILTKERGNGKTICPTPSELRHDVEITGAEEKHQDPRVNIYEEKLRIRKSFNLEGDCPIFPFLPTYLKVTVGATLRLLDIMRLKSMKSSCNSDTNIKSMPEQERFIGINWDGGRHHAMKRRASGFCYINDIVLLLQKLRKMGFHKLTYLDFDLHHGDGVEKAMLYSKNVQTISLHLYETGFFPCSGSLKDTKGNTTINLPLKHGLDDDYLRQLMDTVILPCIEKFEPEALVIQCGSDGLMGDTFHEWQLSIRGLTENIISVLRRFPQCHVILLGGGGYNITLSSRFYAFLTWNVLNEFGSTNLVDPFTDQEKEHHIGSQDVDTYDVLIPDHEYSEMYGDSECHKFWIYDQEGSSLYRPLRNDNTPALLSQLQRHYNTV